MFHRLLAAHPFSILLGFFGGRKIAKCFFPWLEFRWLIFLGIKVAKVVRDSRGVCIDFRCFSSVSLGGRSESFLYMVFGKWRFNIHQPWNWYSSVSLDTEWSDNLSDYNFCNWCWNLKAFVLKMRWCIALFYRRFWKKILSFKNWWIASSRKSFAFFSQPLDWFFRKTNLAGTRGQPPPPSHEKSINLSEI